MEEEYTYYNPIKLKEHMPNAKEIATLLNIKSSTGSYHNTFIKAALRDNLAKCSDSKQYFYETKHGLMQVYPMRYILKNLLYVFTGSEFTWNEYKDGVAFYTCKISDKSYKLYVPSKDDSPLESYASYWRTLYETKEDDSSD